MASLIANQLRMQKFLAQKFEVLESKNTLMSALADGSVCECNLTPVPTALTNSVNKSFNASFWDSLNTTSDESDKISLTKLLGGCGAGAPSLFEIGKKVPGTLTGLTVKDIKLAHLHPIHPSLPANLRLDWKGTWEVVLESDERIIPLAPVLVGQQFTVYNQGSSPETARRIKRCFGTSSSTTVIDCLNRRKVYDPLGPSPDSDGCVNAFEDFNLTALDLATACTDANHPSPLSVFYNSGSAPHDYDRIVRFVTTCPRKFCETKGYSNGWLVDASATDPNDRSVRCSQ